MKVKRSKKRKCIFLFFSVLLIWAGVYYYNAVIIPVVKSVSEEKMRAITVDAVNEAVKNSLEEMPSYADMTKMTYDKDGNISTIVVNSSAINDIVQRMTKNVAQKLDAIDRYGIEVPVGSLSGVLFLAGKGPEISLRIVPIGSVIPQLCSEFKEVGINQTNHRIYLKLNTNVNLVLPGAHNLIETITEVSISECIIVGKIPSTYLNSTSTEDMMDLIP